jgi:hypothetical protein
MSDEKEESGADRFPRTEHASHATLELLAQANMDELNAKEDAGKETAAYVRCREEADRLRERAEVEAFGFRFAYHLRQEMKQGHTDPQRMVGAAMRAANLAPLVPLSGEARPPRHAEAGATADMGVSRTYVAAYNRAITDAHNAMADEFGHGSQDRDGIRAQAAIRRLYMREEGVSLMDSHEAHAVLSSIGVPSKGVDGRMLSVRERIRALEKQCSDALDEYAAFSVMGGEAKTLPERIRLLGDSWRRLEAQGTTIPSSLLSENERRFRAEVAERLWWALGPSGSQAKKHDLDAMLAEVVRANEDALKWRSREVSATGIRDAALEDAISAVPISLPTNYYRETVERIRALESKPATDTPAPDEWPMLTAFSCVMRGLLDYHRPKKGGPEGWQKDRPERWLHRVREETNDLGLLLTAKERPLPQEVQRAAADVANMAMMVSDAYACQYAGSGEEKQAVTPTPPLCLTAGCEKPTGHAPPCAPCGAKPSPAWRSGYDQSAPVVIGPDGTGTAAQPSGDSGELPAPSEGVPCLVGLRAIQEEGMKRAAEKWERGEMDGPTPEPVHDFGWALARMREGKRVAYPEWWAFKRKIKWVRLALGITETIVDDTGEGVRFTQDVLLGTNWQVVE